MLDARSEMVRAGLAALAELTPACERRERAGYSVFRASRKPSLQERAYATWCASVAGVLACRTAKVVLTRGWLPAVDHKAHLDPPACKRREGSRKEVDREFEQALRGPWEAEPGQGNRYGAVHLAVTPSLEVVAGPEKLRSWRTWQSAQHSYDARRIKTGKPMLGAPVLGAEEKERVKQMARALWWCRIMRLEEKPGGALLLTEWPEGSHPAEGVRIEIREGRVKRLNGDKQAGADALRWIEHGWQRGDQERAERLEGLERECPIITLLMGSEEEGWNRPKEWEVELGHAEECARTWVRGRIGWRGHVPACTRIDANALERLTRYPEVKGLLESRTTLQQWWLEQPKEVLGTAVAELRAGKPLLQALGGRQTPKEDVREAAVREDRKAIEGAVKRLWALAKPKGWREAVPMSRLANGSIGALLLEDPERWCDWFVSCPQKLVEADEVLEDTMNSSWEFLTEGEDQVLVRMGEAELARMLWRALRGGKTVPRGIGGLADSLATLAEDVLGMGRRTRRGVKVEYSLKALWKHGVQRWKALSELSEEMHHPRWRARWVARRQGVDAQFLEKLEDPEAPAAPVEPWDEVCQLRSRASLVVEGELMAHCVAGRLEDMVSGETMLFHVGERAPKGCTVEIRRPVRTDGKFTIEELQGYRNERHDEWGMMVAQDLAERLQQWWEGMKPAQRAQELVDQEDRTREVREAVEQQEIGDPGEHRRRMWPGLYSELLPASMGPGKGGGE